MCGRAEGEYAILNKCELRKRLKAERAALDMSDAEKKSAAICAHLISSDIFKNASAVMLYLPIKNEVETTPLIEKAFLEKKTVLVPHTEEDNIFPVILKKDGILLTGAYNIKEPKDRVIWDGKIDLCIVPGVGFDMRGARIGFGKGCYDRFFKRYNMKKAGFAYSFQIADKIDAEPHDIFMDIIVTEEGLFYCE